MTAPLRVPSLGLSGRVLFIGLMTVLTVSVQTTQAQSYLLTLSQNQLLNPSNQLKPNNNINKEVAAVETDDFEENIFTEEDNSTVIVVKNTRTQVPADLPQSAMDIITIVWYVATFLALAAFFLLMACSDRRCGNNQRNGSNSNTDTPLPPPTPSPSYSEFAPPSYETVMKKEHAAKTSIFVIPLGIDSAKESNNNNNNSDNANNNGNNTPNTPTTPIVNFYTINELQKFGS